MSDYIPVRDLAPCERCGLPVGPVFYRATIEQVIEPARLPKMAASVFNPSSGEGALVFQRSRATLCTSCMLAEDAVSRLLEAGAVTDEARKRAGEVKP